MQVLVADGGTDQTWYLFGLDLIYQDDGSETRHLLADGLGSARIELVSDTVETVFTYSPYGNLLEQTEASGTIYGRKLVLIQLSGVRNESTILRHSTR